MIPITPAEIRKLLEVTDRLGIHREAVTIQLARNGEGEVRLTPDGRRIEITAPASTPVERWLEPLSLLVGRLDLGRVRKLETDDL